MTDEKRKREVCKRPDRVRQELRKGGTRTVESDESKSAKKIGGKK